MHIIPKDKPVLSQTFDIFIPFTPAELAAKTRDMLTEMDSLDSLAEKKKELMADLKAADAAARTRVSEMRSKLRAGGEKRPVMCQRKVDVEALTVTWARRDTGEEVEVRPMTDSERFEFKQPTLPGVLDPEDATREPRGAPGTNNAPSNDALVKMVLRLRGDAGRPDLAALLEELGTPWLEVPHVIHAMNEATWPLLRRAALLTRASRIGFEDTLTLEDGTPAHDNSELYSVALSLMAGVR